MNLTKLTLCALLISPLLISPLVCADETKHYGSERLTKEEFINALKPKPKYKTRGIRFNTPEPETSLAISVHFEDNSALLTSEAVEHLNPLGQALNSEELAPYSFVIDGHTDARGTDEYNLDLSKQRALAVGNYLYANFGVDAARLVLNGKGEHELYDAQQPASGINRRVEITTIVSNTESE